MNPGFLDGCHLLEQVWAYQHSRMVTGPVTYLKKNDQHLAGRFVKDSLHTGVRLAMNHPSGGWAKGGLHDESLLSTSYPGG